MLSPAGGEASKNCSTLFHVSSTRRISNPDVVQKIKIDRLCPTKLWSLRVMSELNSSSFKMLLVSFDETSTEIDSTGHCVAVIHLGSSQLHFGENDVFKTPLVKSMVFFQSQIPRTQGL